MVDVLNNLAISIQWQLKGEIKDANLVIERQSEVLSRFPIYAKELGVSVEKIGNVTKDMRLASVPAKSFSEVYEELQAMGRKQGGPTLG